MEMSLPRPQKCVLNCWTCVQFLQHRFTFRPIYAPDTPSRLPPNVLLRGVKQRILKWAKKIVHAFLVLAVWLVLLPNYCGLSVCF